MSKRRFFLVGLPVVLALVVGGAVWFARPQKNVIIIEVTGRPGLAINGTAEVDGGSQELTGAVPAQFVLEGYRVTYSMASAEHTGEVRVRAVIGDAAIGSATTGDPPTRGVRGWVKSGWGWFPPKHWIESFDRQGEQPWLVPPP